MIGLLSWTSFLGKRTNAGPPVERHVRLPLVTVIITNFNYSRFVGCAIASVASQTYKNIECVIVDDHSSDDSIDVINATLKTVRRAGFKLICHKKNLGQLEAMRTGFNASTGAFVNFLDADDLLTPGFIEAHVSAQLNSARSAAVSASDTIQIDDEGQILEGTYHQFLKHRGVDASGILSKEMEGASIVEALSPASIPDTSHERVCWSNDANCLHYIHPNFYGWSVNACSSLFFRRAVLELIFPAESVSQRICGDYYLYRFSHAIGGTLTIPLSLSYFRLHGGNNYSSERVLGGFYSAGKRRVEVEEEFDRLIAAQIAGNFELWTNLIGRQQVARLLKIGLFERKNTLQHQLGWDSAV